MISCLYGTCDENKARNLGGVVLAFVGDAVYSLIVREKLVSEGDYRANELNSLSAKIVCAEAQSALATKLFTVFTEEETDVFRRARNAKKGTRPKHADVAEYNNATGLEAVFGYLYLTGNIDRIRYLVSYGEHYDEDRR